MKNLLKTIRIAHDKGKGLNKNTWISPSAYSRKFLRECKHSLSGAQNRSKNSHQKCQGRLWPWWGTELRPITECCRIGLSENRHFEIRTDRVICGDSYIRTKTSQRLVHGTKSGSWTAPTTFVWARGGGVKVASGKMNGGRYFGYKN